MRILRRACGATLIVLVAVPVYRLLYGREIGIMGADILTFTEQDRALMLAGAPIAIVLGLLAGRIAGWQNLERFASWITRSLARVPIRWLSLALSVFAAAYAAGFSLLVLDGKPNQMDAMAQLLHARFVAAGHLAGPVDRWNEFWHIQNSLVTPRGWVSQYPPGHVILLALGFKIGAVWLVGPMLCGLTIGFTALAAERLLPEDRGVARFGSLLAAASPFFIAHAGAYMNHVSAAAAGAASVYFAVRARDDRSAAWALLSGAAIGAGFAIRPLAAVVVAMVVAFVLLSSSSKSAPSLRRRTRVAFAAAVGAAPFAAAVGAYNAWFFGSPFRFGYAAAQGPAMALGFHRDPWGNMYGAAEAVGFTSADLTALSLHLLGTPIPLVIVVGLFLITAQHLAEGTKIIALWALLPVAANTLYWHHGMFMGPRMLNEFAPAWVLLAAVAAIELVRRVPPSWEPRGYSGRAAIAYLLCLATAAGIFYIGPDRLRHYGNEWMASTRIELPTASEPTLVFVHGGWTGRIAMRLAGRGMRLDSLETALRENPTCDVHHFATDYPAAPSTRPGRQLDFTVRAPVPRERIQVSKGNWVLRGGSRPSETCMREVAADARGTVDITPLVWQGDLPGAKPNGHMVVRDMGPEANAALIAANPDRAPMMLMRLSDDQAPILLPYSRAVPLLWAPHARERL